MTVTDPRPQSSDAMGAASLDDLAERLTALLSSQSHRDIQINDVAPLPGHAGVGYSFIADNGSETRKMIVRTIAPDGPTTGPSDVIRQALIMRSLSGTGVPVPEIYSFGDGNSAFGRPHFIAEFVAGTGLPGKRAEQTEVHAALARCGVEVMARLHQVKWQDVASAWGEPQPLRQEFDRLYRLYDRPTIDSAKAGKIETLREQLLNSAPDHFAVGCVHGDLHFGNMIFGQHEVKAVLDWEIAFLGSTLLDLGLLAFYADPAAGLPEHSHRAERWVLTPDEIIDTYNAALGKTASARDIAWHRAFAGYRFAIFTLFNEMLHRRGKKHDPMWADVIRSVPTMVDRSLELLAATAR